MIISNIVIWETLHHNANWDCSKTLTLLEILKSGRMLCIFGSHTFVLISWMCKKQTSVSHSSTESEVISLDAGLRMDAIPALDLRDLVNEVLLYSSNQVQGNLNRVKQLRTHTSTKPKNQHKQDNIDLVHVDHVASNAKLSHSGAMLYIFEDNEAVIKMIIKGRSPRVRHVSRTHRVALDCFFFFYRINLDPKIQIKYIDTKQQLADILTKGNSHVMSGAILSIEPTLAMSALPAVLRQ